MSLDGPVLITGGAGFIGANLADRIAAKGREVYVYDSLVRPGVERNLAWLKARHGALVTAIQADVRDSDSLGRAAMEAGAVFHLAAQVAVTTSLVDPREDYGVNLQGTVNLLEALRERGEPVPVVFASTNKVYGDLADLELEQTETGWAPVDEAMRRHGVGETRPLDFHTPYGCSKGAADQYVLDYCRSFGLPTCVLRMSCIYGMRQMGTEDQGWVAHFAIRVLQDQAITLYGDGQQVRDVLDVSNAVDAYLSAWKHIGHVQGRAFNLGGGPANAVSLRQVVSEIERLTGRTARIESSDWRMGDQRWYVADARQASENLRLGDPKPWRKGLADLVAWLEAERRSPAPAAREEVAA